jgi:hypothetical protein
LASAYFVTVPVHPPKSPPPYPGLTITNATFSNLTAWSNTVTVTQAVG